MTTLQPNPHSPHADADPSYRHVFPTLALFGDPAPGVLATTACVRLAVVPDKPLQDTNAGDGALPAGLCPGCVAVIQGGPEPEYPASECRECGSTNRHDGLCALCRMDQHEKWWPTRPRTVTPDVITVDDDGHKTTIIKLTRACNGCGQLLGDADERDVDDDGNLTDVRGECEQCRPLVELEAAGCRTWHVLPRDLNRIDDAIDAYGVFAKGYFEAVDGRTTVTGLRVGDGRPDRVVAKFGDWLVRHPDGRFTVHHGPSA